MTEKYLCQICGQMLIEPRLLDCLHNFCTKCLIAGRSVQEFKKTLSQEETIPSSNPEGNYVGDAIADMPVELVTTVSPQGVQCFICGFETILTDGGISSLPLNVKLQNEIINVKNKLPPCDLCSTSANAFTKCYECDITMCALCTDSHEKFRDTTFHTLVQLKADTGKTSNTINQQVECNMHPGQDVNFFCWSCSELICYTCSSTLHSCHKMDSVQQGVVKVTDSIKDALNNARPLIKQAHLNVDALRHKINKVKNRCEDVEKEIEQFMYSYKEALQNHWQTLLKEVEGIKQSRLEILQKNYELFEEKLRRGQTAVELGEDLIQESTAPVEALSIAKPVLDNLEQMYTETSLYSGTKVSDFLKFLPDERNIDSEKYQLFGIISTQSISPDACTLQIDGLLSCRQHKKSSFILTTRDCENQPLLHGGEKVIAELRYKDAVQKVVPVYVNDECNGTYTLAFTPNISGNMLLTVFIQNKHIKGSPYKVVVSSLIPHNGIFHCCAFCTSGGNKTATCGCNSKMPGYNGCGHGHTGHPGRRHWSCCGNVLQNSECSIPYHFT